MAQMGRAEGSGSEEAPVCGDSDHSERSQPTIKTAHGRPIGHG
ncbi:MAG: hypothetical protein QOH79_3319 [Acidimicrobiaceae bacterium]